ncbi:MAG: multiheme c-type cytochrome [Pseudomonadota bacterium]
MVILATLIPVSGWASQGGHAFMKDPARCPQCHVSDAGEPEGVFTRDIVSLCMDCHPMAHRTSHPVDIKPQNPVSAGLPLDRDGTITCDTCHDPHSNPFSPSPFVYRGILDRLRNSLSPEGYPTFYLRMPNNDGRLCLSCHESKEMDQGYLKTTTTFERDYTGSRTCERCHTSIFNQWKKTPHARTLQSPRETPEAMEARFTGNESFGPDDVEIVIGVHWTQRYAIYRQGELKIAPEAWSLEKSSWARPFWREQPWRDYCAGCHLTGYDPYKGAYVEQGVGCEMCHGPGGGHVRSGNGEDIVNPARLEGTLASSICASCHTNGHDRTGQFRYPVGFVPGENLGRYFRGLLPQTGQGPDSYKDDGTLEDRLRSLEFWQQQFFKPARILCRQCRNLYALPAGAELEKTADLTLAQYCRSCHKEHASDPDHSLMVGKDVNCLSCHEPLEDNLGRPSIHDHKYVYYK